MFLDVGLYCRWMLLWMKRLENLQSFQQTFFLHQQPHYLSACRIEKYEKHTRKDKKAIVELMRRAPTNHPLHTEPILLKMTLLCCWDSFVHFLGASKLHNPNILLTKSTSMTETNNIYTLELIFRAFMWEHLFSACFSNTCVKSFNWRKNCWKTLEHNLSSDWQFILFLCLQWG